MTQFDGRSLKELSSEGIGAVYFPLGTVIDSIVMGISNGKISLLIGDHERLISVREAEAMRKGLAHLIEKIGVNS